VPIGTYDAPSDLRMVERTSTTMVPNETRSTPMKFAITFVIAAALVAASCTSDETSESTPDHTSATTSVEQVEDITPTAEAGATTAATGQASAFQIEVWADNWMAVYVDGELVGEDSVSITTERSFNAETFTFEASAPFTIAIEAKDFKETDSGIEYIGEQNQHMGDGGLVAQVTNLATGEIVDATDSSWSTLVVHQAPLNTECERDADPDATCEFSILETPTDWTSADFDDSSWNAATEWSAADVSPKDGYDEITWSSSAQLIWGTDLEVDNTILLRSTIS
jgi:hypothetical protein